jgi:putative oxidoreductase
MRYATSPILAVRSTLPHAVLAVLRVMAALMLVQHGVQKWLGLLLPPDRQWGGTPELLSRTGIAGTLEIVGGALLAVGLLTRPVAFLLSGLMAAAYFLAHAPQGPWPILNRGELAALYCFVFLALWALGPGRFSVDALLAGRTRDATTGREELPRPAAERRRGAA